MRKFSLFLAGGVGLCVAGLVPALCGQLVIDEVLFDPPGVNAGRQVVDIRNLGDTVVNMQSSGYWLYFPPARWQFPPGVTIEPGQTAKVYVNRPGSNTSSEFFTGISGMRSLRSQGPLGDAIGLFSTSLFGDPSQIIDFVQWGGAGNGGEDVAVQAAIWPAGGFVSLSVLREGSSIAYDGSGDSPSDWCADGTPTLGLPNDACTPSFAQSPVILNEIGYDRTGPGHYHPAVELRNVGGVLEDLGGKWIVLGGQHSYQFPLGTPDTLIGPGELAVVHLGVDGSNGPLGFFAGAGTFRDLNASDSVSFHAVAPFTDPTGVLDFVEWGAAGAPVESAAVTAHVWSVGDFVNSADRSARGSIAARDAQIGVSRWIVDNTGTIGLENSAPPQVPAVINEVIVDPAGSNVQRTVVELKNLLSDESLSLAGFKLCVESSALPGTPRCYSFAAQAKITPGGFLLVNLNRNGIAGGLNVYTWAFQDLDPARGSLFLLVSASESDPNNLVDFVRWGSDPGFGEAMALAVGVWDGGSVDTSAVRDGSSISYSGNGDSPRSYRVDRTPSPGQDNTEACRESPFRRGDCNDDRRVDISDAVSLLNFLFAGGHESLCTDACDTNNDESRDISDPVFLLNHLFGGGPEPSAPGPGPDCGAEAEPGILCCGSYLSC